MVSRLAFGNLARHGFARPEIGPLSAFELRGRVPLIDVGTIAAVKRGEIAVKPAVVRFTETGAAFADGSTGDFDGVVLATGYRPALEEIVTVPGVLDDGGYPRDWKGGGTTPNLFFVGYMQPRNRIAAPDRDRGRGGRGRDRWDERSSLRISRLG